MARFNPPPNWPTPPPGWQPEPGWSPDSAWPPPPAGWQLWVDDTSSSVGYEGQIPPGWQPAPSGRGTPPRRSRPGIRIVLIAGLLVIVVASTIWALIRHSSAEKSYLAAVKNPCQHPEIIDTSGDNCSFVWQGDDDDLVSEGHEICSIQQSVPATARYAASADYLQRRHPYYSTIQINTQMIAAEQTLC